MPETKSGVSLDRRAFLKASAAAAACAGIAAPFEALAFGGLGRIGVSPDYGPLAPREDDATGLPLLELPEGFRYRSMSWTGDPMWNGEPTPGRHDGGAALWAGFGAVAYVRNHEQQAPFAATPGSFAPPSRTYDAGLAPGGTTTLFFHTVLGRHLGTVPSLSGTVRNCAGGPTPWSTWLSCEENMDGPGALLEEPHGYVFEVPVWRRPSAQPLRGLGRFFHEAVAVEPWSGVVYQTEDRAASGLYRFVPKRWGRLDAGGALQMLALDGLPNFDTGQALANGSSFGVSWVPIDEPENDPFSQGFDRGGAVFPRGEGMWHGRGRIYFTATAGGGAGRGQVWELDPWRQRLTLLYESPGADALDGPDNVTVSPRGSLLLCEDGLGGNFVRGLTRGGAIFDFAHNNVVLGASPNGVVPPGDYRSSEFAGACFTPDGRWLFVSVQTPGVTFAITGPWRRGPL